MKKRKLYGTIVVAGPFDDDEYGRALAESYKKYYGGYIKRIKRGKKTILLVCLRLKELVKTGKRTWEKGSWKVQSFTNPPGLLIQGKHGKEKFKLVLSYSDLLKLSKLPIEDWKNLYGIPKHLASDLRVIVDEVLKNEKSRR